LYLNENFTEMIKWTY